MEGDVWGKLVVVFVEWGFLFGVLEWFKVLILVGNIFFLKVEFVKISFCLFLLCVC